MSWSACAREAATLSPYLSMSDCRLCDAKNLCEVYESRLDSDLYTIFSIFTKIELKIIVGFDVC